MQDRVRVKREKKSIEYISLARSNTGEGYELWASYGVEGGKPVCEILKPRRNTNLAAVEDNGGVIHIICGTTQIMNSDSSPQQQC